MKSTNATHTTNDSAASAQELNPYDTITQNLISRMKKTGPPISQYAHINEDSKTEIGDLHYSFNKDCMNLNATGFNLITLCNERIAKGDHKGTIKNYFKIFTHSGFSQEMKMKLDNYTINGILDDSGDCQTSIVVLMDPDNKWVYTKSGSLYALGLKV
jgi:hypothetical protein